MRRERGAAARAAGRERARRGIPRRELIRQLNADPEALWRDYASQGLTQAKLARLLGEFDIRSGNVRFPDGTQSKGYRRADFLDAWTRYCPPTGGEPSRPSQASPPSSERDALHPWDGSKRPTEPNRPSLTSIATPGTAGTDNPATTERGAA